MIPATGWLSPANNQGAPIASAPLPTPHRATYRDGATPPIVSGTSAFAVVHAAGASDAAVLAGSNDAAGLLLVATLTRADVFGIVLLDRLDVPPTWARCGTAPDTPWTTCATTDTPTGTP